MNVFSVTRSIRRSDLGRWWSKKSTRKPRKETYSQANRGDSLRPPMSAMWSDRNHILRAVYVSRRLSLVLAYTCSHQACRRACIQATRRPISHRRTDTSRSKCDGQCILAIISQAVMVPYVWHDDNMILRLRNSDKIFISLRDSQTQHTRNIKIPV